MWHTLLSANAGYEIRNSVVCDTNDADRPGFRRSAGRMEPEKLFAYPLHTSLLAGSSNLMTVGVNHDTLLTAGWLDLAKGPQVLHVPDFSGRYYSVQFTDPFNVDFAYVGTRTTGTQAGDYLITGTDWKGQIPSGIEQISAPSNSVLVIGRVLVYSDNELSTAYNLAKQIRLRPFSPTQPDR
jgi:hypothetical protein